MSQPDILTYNLHPWKMGKVCHNGITNTGSWELQWLISKRLLSNLQIFILASVVWIRAWRNISVTSSVGEFSSVSGFSGLCPEFQKRSQCLKLCNQISVLIRTQYFLQTGFSIYSPAIALLDLPLKPACIHLMCLCLCLARFVTHVD